MGGSMDPGKREVWGVGKPLVDKVNLRVSARRGSTDTGSRGGWSTHMGLSCVGGVSCNPLNKVEPFKC